MKFLFLILIFVLIFSIGCSKIGFTPQSLPDKYTVYLYSDGTSSGASRYYHSYMTFENGKTTFANRSYTTDGISGKHYCFDEYKNNKWVNVERKDEWYDHWVQNYNKGVVPESNTELCGENLPFYLSEKEFSNALRNKEIVPMKDFCHYEICFKILKS